MGTDLTELTPGSEQSAEWRAPYMTLAVRLVRMFRPADGVSPEVFLSAIVSVMTHYPIDVIRTICDPFTGLPAAQKWMPTPYDVKQACEREMAPRRRAEQRARDVEAQLADRAAMEIDRGDRPSLEELEEQMAAVGIKTAGWHRRHRYDIDDKRRAELREQLGSEAFDALPKRVRHGGGYPVTTEEF